MGPLGTVTGAHTLVTTRGVVISGTSPTEWAIDRSCQCGDARPVTRRGVWQPVRHVGDGLRDSKGQCLLKWAGLALHRKEMD